MNQFISDLLKRILDALPLSVGISVLIIYFVIKKWDWLQTAYGVVSSFLGFWKWIRKSSIKNTLEGNLSSFARKINSDFDELIVPKVKIEFVNEKNLEAFIEKGQPIIRMNFSRNSNENLVNATINYVKTALLSSSKNYVQKEIVSAVDLSITRKMLVEDKRNEAITYFDTRYLMPEFEKPSLVKDYYNRVQEIDEGGFLTRFLLREYRDFGQAVFPAVPSDKHKNESMAFFDFVHTLSIRSKEEEVPLCFNRAYIHVGVILVSKRETYEMYGLGAYIRRIRLVARNGVKTFYLLAGGEKNTDILEELRKTLLVDENFQEICCRKYFTKGQVSILSLIKFDYDGFVSNAETILSEAVKNNTEVNAFIVKVESTYLEVDINGISATIPLEELSSKTITDATKYFKQEEELKVKVLNFTNLKDVSVSNKNTETDPVILIEKDYSAGKFLRATIVNIKDFGLLVRLEDGMDGFVPYSKATYSRFQRLDTLYKTGDMVEGEILNFNSTRKSLVLSIANLTDPWLVVKQKYKINAIVTARICAIEEKKIVCELEQGVEGIIWRSDLDWIITDIGSMKINIGDTIKAKIKNINSERRVIQLNRKEILNNPVLKFFDEHKDLEITAEVINIIEGYAAEIKLQDNIKGLVHISEIDWRYITDIQTVCPLGSQIKVKLIELDTEKNIIYASRKQTIANPIEKFMKQYRVGDVVKGKVLKNESWGASIKLSEEFSNVNFFITKGELSNFLYVKDAITVLENGREYSFLIKSIDPEKQRVLLSRKLLFDKVFDTLKINYGQPYKVKVIGIKTSGEYVVENNDCFQGVLIASSDQPTKKTKISVGNYIDIYIARIDESRKSVEAHIEGTQRQTLIRRY